MLQKRTLPLEIASKMILKIIPYTIIILIVIASQLNPTKANASTVSLTNNEWQPTQEAVLMAPISDINYDNEYNRFGYAVSISRDTIFIGSPDTSQKTNGKVYIAKKTNGNWSIENTLQTTRDNNINDEFGYSISISGNMLVIGAPGETVNNTPQAGAVYVFSLSNGSWIENARLTSSTPTSFSGFGESIAISGDTIAIGSRREKVNGKDTAGAVYIYNNLNESWNFNQKLVRENPVSGEQFGYSIAFMNDDNLLIGSPSLGGLPPGAIIGFEKSNNNWNKTITIAPPETSETAWFGYSIATTNNKIAVGAAKSAYYNTGYFYLYSTNGNRLDPTPISIQDTRNSEDFAKAIAISKDTIIIGDSLTETVTPYILNNDKLDEQEPLTFNNPYSTVRRFGYSISISDDTIVVGAPVLPGKDEGAGSVFIYNIKKTPKEVTPVPLHEKKEIAIITILIGLSILYKSRRRTIFKKYF